MNHKKRKLRVYEQIRVYDFLKILFFKYPNYYSTTSFLVRILVRILKIDLSKYSTYLCYGMIQKSTGIRKNAYANAMEDLGLLKLGQIKFGIKHTILIDETLILKKFYLDYLFKKYEFYGICNQVILEHPELNVEVKIVSHIARNTIIKKENCLIRKAIYISRLEFLISLVVLPVKIFLFYKLNSSKGNRRLENGIVCEIDSMKMYHMFNDIFSSFANVFYIIQRVYLSNFTEEFLSKDNILVHGLSESQFILLRKIIYRMLYLGIFNFRNLSKFGSTILELGTVISNGMLLSFEGKGCLYATFEHLSTAKAFRNEILKKNNNLSIFIPYNAYAIDHFYTPEFMYNYDVLCSSGELLERIYKMQSAKTNIFLKTGSYHPYKRNIASLNFNTKIGNLKKFKSEHIVITFLSNGIQDETLSGEERMMKLVRDLLKIEGVRIIIRQKPVVPSKKYRNFFENQARGLDSVMLTHSEYDLFDFLECTDLFLTTNSSSAVDLCIAGGQFYSIDFWDDKDLYLWQTSVGGVFISEKDAYNIIQNWVENKFGERLNHSKRMLKLASLINYKFPNFDTYKSNLLNNLSTYLPNEVLRKEEYR